MRAATLDNRNFLDAYKPFELSITGQEPAWLTGLRKKAIGEFERLGYPTTRHEDWRFTNLESFTKVPFALSNGALDRSAVRAAIDRVSFHGLETYTAVFVNGRFLPELSSIESLPQGMVLTGIGDGLDKYADLIRANLGMHADFDSYTFSALNTAFMADGVFLWFDAGVVLDKPIHAVYVSSGDGKTAASFPRNLIILEKESKATIIESFVGIDDEEYLTNSVSEIVVDDNAQLTHYKLQRENKKAYHFATTAVRQGKDSRFESMNISLGGRLTRNDVFARLEGESAHSSLDGFYLLDGEQQVDNFTRMVHAAESCTSRQIFKGILDGKSHGVFDGRILVEKGAQKTDAVQTNRNLLLSDDAVANAKPQLEIYADDVKCTHGATTGQLDENQLFYLRSRGFELTRAKALLTYAFVGELIEEIKLEPMREELSREVIAMMG